MDTVTLARQERERQDSESTSTNSDSDKISTNIDCEEMCTNTGGNKEMDTVTLARQERERQDSESTSTNSDSDTISTNIDCEEMCTNTGGGQILSNIGDGNKEMDTVTLARQERERQGSCEVEISYGGEVDLHRHLSDCEKNPGHHTFIPVNQFNVDHLPPFYHNNDIAEFIRAQSDVTARVSVKYVSENRPETGPGGDKPYPFSNKSCSDMLRVGTGWVHEVKIYRSKFSNNKMCECKECLNSPTPNTQFAHINILTAAHVVYDDLEAAHTTCHLFFDKGGAPDACSGVVTLNGMSYVRSNIDSDWCDIRYVTHDLDLADRLDKMVKNRDDLYNSVKNKYDEVWFENAMRQLSTKQPVSKQHLIIIVSHPHGCSKQISVGEWVNRTNCDSMIIETYTTATCPGSSGAFVFILAWDWSSSLSQHVHCGNHGPDKTLNYCSLIY